MNKLTKEQSVIISAYTGYLCCPFSDLQKYAETKLGAGIGTISMLIFKEELKEKSKEDFLKICYDGD